MGTVPHRAFQLLRSASVTPRAREQAPQENTGIFLSTIFAIVSLRGPPDRLDRINGCLAHEVRSVVSEKYLQLVAGLGQSYAMGKHEGCASRPSVPQELLIKMSVSS